jgi:peptidoglycan/xylan/chitin deacetylase (PgdA/CDA1 family)
VNVPLRSGAVLAALFFLFYSLCLPGYAQSAFCSADPAKSKMIALTFDDGPSTIVTRELLDGLKQRGVHATFFLIGSRIEGNEDLILRMEREGHQVGIHTYSHVAVTGLTRQQFDQQIGRTRTLLTSILGDEFFPVRPPYGFVDQNVIRWSNAPIILWSVDPKDWSDHNVPRISNAIVQKAKPGDIVLLHDIFTSTLNATLSAVDQLRQQGYYFVTVEQLFNAYGIPLETGTIYRCAPVGGAENTILDEKRKSEVGWDQREIRINQLRSRVLFKFST